MGIKKGDRQTPIVAIIESITAKQIAADKIFKSIRVGDRLTLIYKRKMKREIYGGGNFTGDINIRHGEVIQKTCNIVIIQDVKRKFLRQDISVSMILSGHVRVEVMVG